MSLGRLVINGDEIYELDESCLREKRVRREKESHSRLLEEQQIRKTNLQKEKKS